MEPDDEWDDRELSGSDSLSTDSDRSSFPWLPWLLWALIPLGLGVLLFYLRGSEPSPPVENGAAFSNPTPSSPSEAATEEAAENAIDLPPLDQSDDLFREMASKLGSHSLFELLLSTDDLARKVVVSVANIAEGASPAKQLSHVRPEEKFGALETSERIVLDPASYRRYDGFAELFSSLDASAVARFFRTFEPLLEEAHRELGLSERAGFRDTLSRAIGVLMSAPVVEGPIRLRAVSVNYAFEDPALESLLSAQKHLVRMGPENTRRIQKKLSEIRQALGLAPISSEARP